MSTRITVAVGDHPLFLFSPLMAKLLIFLILKYGINILGILAMHALKGPQPKLNFKN